MNNNLASSTDTPKGNERAATRRHGIKPAIRTFLLALLILILLASGAGAGFSCFSPKSLTEQVTIFTYKQTANTDYTVNLKENEIYGAGVMTADGVYLTKLVTGIDAGFNYLFQAEGKARIKGSYEIVAIMEGSQRVDREDVIIWTKQYVLVPKTAFSEESGQLSLSPKLNIDFNSYRNFVAETIEALDFRFNSNLTVRMNVELSADSENGAIKEKAAPAISFPLNRDYFEVARSGEMKNKEGGIHKDVTTKAPIDRKALAFYLVVLAIAILGLLYVGLFTRKDDGGSTAAVRMKAILRRHGSRMVSLTDAEPFPECARRPVDSLEDLLVLSDETGNPVFFHGAEDAEGIGWFCVLVGQNCFIWHPDWNAPKDTDENKQ